MKILMVLMGLEIGGAETHVAELAIELAKRGHEIHVASNGGVYEQEISKHNITHHKLPLHTKRFSCFVKSYSGLKKLIKENKYDIVHAHARIPGFICGILQKKLKFRFITSAHWVFKTNLILRHITNWGERSVAVSNDIKKYLIDNYRYQEENIDVTINGIDTEKFSPQTDWSDIAHEFDLKEEKTRIVYISRMDVDRSAVAFNLLNITPKLLTKYPELEIVIVGGGNDYKRLLTKAEEVNNTLGNRVVITTNSRTDINKFVASSTMFIGVSRAALEAMSVEKPVIIAGNEGYIGVFDEDKVDVSIKTNFCCRGCDMCTDEILYKDICSILDSNKIVETGKYNRQFILNNYSVTKMADDYVDAYKKLLKKNPFRENDVLISGYYGYKNIGDDSMLKAIIQEIRKQKPDVTITVLSKKPVETALRYGVNSINRYNLIKICRLLKHTRLLISGGGSLLQDVTSTHSYKYYSSIIKLALKFKTKVMVYANGIGPLISDKDRADCKKILEKVDFISLRDENSMDLLKEIGVTRAVTVSADPALSLQPSGNGIKEDGPYFIVTVRKWKILPDDFVMKISEICRIINKKYGLTPVFVPMQKWMDYDVCNEIASLCNGKLCETIYEVEDLIEYIKNSQFVFGMRLHSIVYSLSVNVPVIALSYDPKVDAVVDKWQSFKAFDVKNINTDEVIEEISNVIENRDNISNEISKITNEMRNRNIEDSKMAVNLMEY